MTCPFHFGKLDPRLPRSLSYSVEHVCSFPLKSVAFLEVDKSDQLIYTIKPAKDLIVFNLLISALELYR